MRLYRAQPRLPIEVWSIIFSTATTSFHFELPLLVPTSILYALTLVCKQWRNIVLSTPVLWSRFTIFVDGTPRIGGMRQWLARAGKAPLYVDISTDRKCNLSSTDLARCMDNIILELMPYRQRLRRFHVQGPWSMPEFIGEQMGTLEDLSIQSRGFRGHSSLDIILNLPLDDLRAIRLEAHADQLLTLHSCANILSRAVRLEECFVDASCIGSLQIKHFSCTALRTLHLLLRSGSEIHSDCALLSFFQAMRSAPALVELTIDWLVSGDVQLGELSSTLARLAPSLRSLRLSYLPMSDAELLDCLEGLDKLESLCLRYSLCGPNDPITSALLHRLAYPHIHLECTGEKFRDEELIAMLDRVESCYLLTPHRRSDRLYKFKKFFQLEHVYP